jgi:uncharacterized RDD family membrane protein YckC
MSEEPVAAETSIRGYLSESSKRRFTITAGILGTVFLIAQFALPFAVMLGSMAFSSEAFDVDFARRDPRYAAVAGRVILFVETEPNFGDEPDSSAIVEARFEPISGTEIVVSDLDGKPYLLAGEDRLWLISRKSIQILQFGHLVSVEQSKELAEISMPFLFEGAPAVLERWPTELALVVHDGTDWQTRATFPLVVPDPECGCGLDWAKAFADERGVHVFLEFGTTLYYGLWNPGLDDDIGWELVGDAGQGWDPVIWHGEPAVFGVTSREDGEDLVGRRRIDGAWKEELRLDRRVGDLVSAFEDRRSDAITVLTGSSYSGTILSLKIDDGGIVGENWIGEEPQDMDLLPGFMVAIMGTQYGTMFLLPLILAIILSAMMRRHRVTAYSSGPRQEEFASLTRRAVAQLIDVAIMAGPSILAMFLFMRMTLAGVTDEPEGFPGFVAFFAPILLSLGWALVIGLLFTFTEGRSGVTPGKWVAKIRVLGTDLQPCGFGRALVRNLLKCVDGFFNFMVGIMVVALSENWQRVGDMAARTVVVDWKPTSADFISREPSASG